MDIFKVIRPNLNSGAYNAEGIDTSVRGYNKGMDLSHGIGCNFANVLTSLVLTFGYGI